MDPQQAAQLQQQQFWGNQLASALEHVTSNNPPLTYVLSNLRVNGLAADPSTLINDITTHSASITFQTIFTLLNGLDMSLSAAQTNQQASTQYSTSLEESIRLRDAQIATLQGVVSSFTSNPTPAHPPQHRLGHRKTTNPPKFCGDMKQEVLARQEEYVQWKKSIQVTFLQDHEHYPTEKDKVLHIIMLIDGTAAKNNAAYIDAAIYSASHPEQTAAENTNNPFADMTISKWNTARNIFASLDSQYITVDAKRADALKYDTLNMTGKNGKITPYPQFLASFNSLAISAGKTAEQKVTDFKKKVSEVLARQFMGMDNPPADNDFAAWSAKGTKFWENLQEFDHNFSKNTTNSNHQQQQQQPKHQQQQQHPKPNTTANGGDGMDLDSMYLRKITPEERAYCILHNLCLYCRGPGHFAKECKKKQLADERNSTRGGHGGGVQRGGTGRGGGSVGGSTRGGYGGGGYGSNSGYGSNGGALRGLEYPQQQGYAPPGWTPYGYPLQASTSYGGSTVAPSTYGSLPAASPQPPFEQQNREFHHYEHPGANAHAQSDSGKD